MNPWLKALVVVAVGLIAWTVIAPSLATRLVVERPIKNAEAIVVLGGSSTYGERTEKAAALFRKGVSEQIVLTNDGERSGWSQAKQTNPPFVELARENLVNRGVPAQSIVVIEKEVNGTMDEANVISEFVRMNDLDSLLLVTSRYHTSRAGDTFEHAFENAGLQTRIGIVAASGADTPDPAFWWLSPDGWKFVAGEYVKSLYYWLYY